MKLHLLATALVALSGPALAWNNTNTGPGPKQIVDGGPGAQSVSRSNATAVSGASSVSGASATGGRATGGSARAAGGAGGSAAGGAGGSASTGSVTVNSSGGGSARAPDVLVPGGGGMDCPTVGFGASGAGIAGGGGFGPSWISPDCNARKLAALLWEMGQRDEAISVLHKQFPDLFPTPAAAPVQPVSAQAAQAARDPKWCRTVDLGHARLSGADEARYQAECR